MRRDSCFDENIKTLYSLMWGQCSEALRARLEGLDEYEEISTELKGLDLLIAIREIVYSFESQKFLPHAVVDAQRRLFLMYQGKSMTLQAYLEHFKDCIEVIEQCGGKIEPHKKIVTMVYREMKITSVISKTEAAEAREAAKQVYLATLFIMGSDRARYGRLIEKTENDFAQGMNTYPRTLTTAYNLLVNWKQDTRNMVRAGGDGVSFATMDGEEHPPKKDKLHITCFKCGKKGHYSNQCKTKKENDTGAGGTPTTNDEGRETGAQMLMAGVEEGEFDDEYETVVFHQDGQVSTNVVENVMGMLKQGKKLPVDWILLDNQSTVDVFQNRKLLRNIRENSTYMDIHCNAGIVSTNLVGDLPGYGTVWYHPKGIANILSLSRLKEKYRVTYDSENGNDFIVHKPDGNYWHFVQSDRGLYYTDVGRDTSEVLVNTVQENLENYTRGAIKRATLARSIQKMIGRPSTKDFLQIMQNNLLPNCPVTRDDIIAAEHIYGPEVGILKGKTVRGKSPEVKVNIEPIPPEISAIYKDVTIAGDVMHVLQV